MFLRRMNKKACGKDHKYWVLVESYRTEEGKVRQRIISYLGDITKKEAEKVYLSSEKYDSYSQDFLSPQDLPENTEILPKKTRTERQRDFGGVWLGNKLFDKLGLDEFFAEREKDWLTIFKILVISRFYHPSSELHIAEHLYEHSAMEDLLGVPPPSIYDNRLYRGLDKLLNHKAALQEHLKDRMGTLFGIDYELFLYDVTSTYFEGEHAGSTICQRGYSRDNRPDCKQVCIALVVTTEGLPLGYEIFSGNTHDSKTVKEIVDVMEKSYGTSQRIWVMDRGMVSEDNLSLLRESGRRYIIGTPKSCLKKYESQLIDKEWQVVHDGVEVKLCKSPEAEGEVFILCKSRDRALKEHAMHNRFIKNIEDALNKLRMECAANKGKDITKKVERRIGRILQTNSRGASFFTIHTEFDKDQFMTVIHAEKHDEQQMYWKRMTEGHYMLRSNITDWDAKQLWKAYIHLTDAEEAFKINKSDLHIRPVWHQKDNRIKGHIFVCFMAFVLWKTFGLMCQKAGLGDEPRRIFNELKRISLVDVILTTSQGKEMKIRTVVKPEKPVLTLLHHLKLSLPQRLTKRIL